MPQTNLVEGDTQEVCVVLGSGVLESGVITVPLIIGLEIPPIESPTPSATCESSSPINYTGMRFGSFARTCVH